MNSRLKQLGKDSVVYGLGAVLAKGVGFLLLPIYTRVFTPEDYGAITMLTVIGSFLGAFLAMGMDASQSFFFNEQKKDGPEAQARLVTAILQWRLAWGSLLVLVSFLFIPLLNAVFFDGRLTPSHFAAAFAGTMFAQLLNQSAEVYRLLYRPWPYLAVTLGNTLVSAAVAVTLVVWLDWGILGYFVGFASGALVVAVSSWYTVRPYLDWSAWHFKWWPRLLRFGAPLVPGSVALYVLNTADRWFLNHYHDAAAVGLYAVGAKFAMLIAMIITTYRQAWWPIAMDALQTDEGPPLFRTMGRLYLGLGSAGIVLLTAFSPWLVRLVTAPAYHDAYPVVGILAWHSLFYGFHLIVVGGIWKREKTAWVSFGMIVAALLNVLLDFLLVPTYGGMGAAAATSISFLVWNIVTLAVSERLSPMNYPLAVLTAQVATGVASSAVILLLFSREQSPGWLAAVAVVAVMVLVALSVPRKEVR